jgi:outer membrane protein TolC
MISSPHAVSRIRGPERRMARLSVSFAFVALAALVSLATQPARAQISFTSAIDLALRSSTRVKAAQAEVERARAALSESKDVFVPSVVASSGLGYSYGYPLGTPTLFSFQAQSLAYNSSQLDYVRAARSGLAAANLSLKDARQQVAEDAAITYLALDHAQQRKAAMAEESGYANKLVQIVQDRLDAGQDTAMELSKARRTKLQLQLQQLQMDDEIATQTDHLVRMLGLGGEQFDTIPNSVPVVPIVSPPSGPLPDGPAVLAAFESAKAKREQAFGDSRYVLRPQVSFAAQYSRFSTFNNYQLYYPAIENNFNAFGVGIQIQLPLYDLTHRAKGRESLAAAVSSENDALFARQQEAEGRIKGQHSADELVLRAQLAQLDNEIAKQQLDAMLVELNSGTGNASGPQMTPKDEQDLRIQERQKYLDLLDSQFQLQQIEIRLLRQTGQLEPWLKSISIKP